MKIKRNKYISKALVVLGYIDEPSDDYNTLEQIDLHIKNAKEGILKMENSILETKELIENIQDQLLFYTDLKNQAEIEEFRDMNPKAKAVYKL